MTAKHTPGPWSWCAVGWEEPSGAFDIEATTADGRHVIIASRYDWQHRVEESEANARLIAAAPELLEALRGLRRWMGPCGLDEEIDAAMRAADAAIAKATGDAP